MHSLVKRTFMLKWLLNRTCKAELGLKLLKLEFSN
jgi:hypothetical protein